jgi:hypothetical protein
VKIRELPRNLLKNMEDRENKRVAKKSIKKYGR